MASLRALDCFFNECNFTDYMYLNVNLMRNVNHGTRERIGVNFNQKASGALQIIYRNYLHVCRNSAR